MASGLFGGPGGIFLSAFTDPACVGRAGETGFSGHRGRPHSPAPARVPVQAEEDADRGEEAAPAIPTARPPAFDGDRIGVLYGDGNVAVTEAGLARSFTTIAAGGAQVALASNRIAVRYETAPLP